MREPTETASLDIGVQDDDIIVLGAASVETRGLASIGEMVGGNQPSGIAEE